MIPCKIFPYKYGFIDKSVLEVILNTCKKIEIPPKPSKNDVNRILIEIFLQAILEIIWIPFVISNKPVRNPCTKVVSILKKLNTGEIAKLVIEIIPLAFKIDIILEKITINPPIRKIVEILLVILWAIISPKLEKVTKEVDFVLL